MELTEVNIVEIPEHNDEIATVVYKAQDGETYSVQIPLENAPTPEDPHNTDNTPYFENQLIGS